VPSERGEGGRATAAGTRTLVYATAMSQARTRVAKALAVIRPPKTPRAAAPWGGDPASLLAELREVGAWLEEFHPHSLVELDYGGLVHLLDDGALCSDQSVAEVSASISAVAAGEAEFATAMYQRFVRRWRALEALEQAS
jgi:hypothetical protein